MATKIPDEHVILHRLVELFRQAAVTPANDPTRRDELATEALALVAHLQPEELARLLTEAAFLSGQGDIGRLQ